MLQNITHRKQAQGAEVQPPTGNALSIQESPLELTTLPSAQTPSSLLFILTIHSIPVHLGFHHFPFHFPLLQPPYSVKQQILSFNHQLNDTWLKAVVSQTGRNLDC